MIQNAFPFITASKNAFDKLLHLKFLHQVIQQSDHKLFINGFHHFLFQATWVSIILLQLKSRTRKHVFIVLPQCIFYFVVIFPIIFVTTIRFILLGIEGFVLFTNHMVDIRRKLGLCKILVASYYTMVYLSCNITKKERKLVE